MNKAMNGLTIIKKIGIYSFLALGAIVSIFPFYWMTISTFKPKEDLFIFPPQLLPLNPTLINFINLLQQTDFARNLLNSLFVAISYTLLSVFLCTLGGYAFAKMNFPGRSVLFMIVVATMTLPFEITLVPLFRMMIDIGWINTYQAVIIPFAARAWGIFLMRQALSDIPSELLDAARMDGSSEFGIFHRIVVPVSKPAIMALAILMFHQFLERLYVATYRAG